MSRQDLVDHVEERIEEQTRTTDIDVKNDRECSTCGTVMPYEEFNEHSPQTDYVVHHVPGQDMFTDSAKKVYCSTSCFVTELQELYGESLLD